MFPSPTIPTTTRLRLSRRGEDQESYVDIFDNSSDNDVNVDQDDEEQASYVELAATALITRGGCRPGRRRKWLYVGIGVESNSNDVDVDQEGEGNFSIVEIALGSNSNDVTIDQEGEGNYSQAFIRLGSTAMISTSVGWRRQLLLCRH